MTNDDIAKIAKAKLVEAGIDADDVFVDEEPDVFPVEHDHAVEGYWVKLEVWVGREEVE